MDNSDTMSIDALFDDVSEIDALFDDVCDTKSNSFDELDALLNADTDVESIYDTELNNDNIDDAETDVESVVDSGVLYTDLNRIHELENNTNETQLNLPLGQSVLFTSQSHQSSRHNKTKNHTSVSQFLSLKSSVRHTSSAKKTIKKVKVTRKRAHDATVHTQPRKKICFDEEGEHISISIIENTMFVNVGVVEESLSYFFGSIRMKKGKHFKNYTANKEVPLDDLIDFLVPLQTNNRLRYDRKNNSCKLVKIFDKIKTSIRFAKYDTSFTS